MKKLKILFVEDTDIIMKISKLLIEDVGYQPDCAFNAEDALELFKKNDYDLVLTDLGLPGMSGIDLISKIREFERQHRTKEAMIYAITAYDLNDVSAQCFASGVNDVFNKPLKKQPLIQMIQNAYLSTLNQTYKQLMST